ncbi:hypothetical protein GGR27_003651 [Lewinella antarctica]|uniref:Uncharacterized protein n=1 Tax=Neolewinella antarctica TaxID=442734 RepID=A0ABX0XFZ8_9BACT|nr:hypothetical protein [Neolewinella antarctica]
MVDLFWGLDNAGKEILVVARAVAILVVGKCPVGDFLSWQIIPLFTRPTESVNYPTHEAQP